MQTERAFGIDAHEGALSLGVQGPGVRIAALVQLEARVAHRFWILGVIDDAKDAHALRLLALGEVAALEVESSLRLGKLAELAVLIHALERRLERAFAHQRQLPVVQVLVSGLDEGFSRQKRRIEAGRSIDRDALAVAHVASWRFAVRPA